MTKLRVLKQGGFSGQKHNVGDVVNVKSTLVDALVKDGRAELVDDEKPAPKKRASTRGSRRRA